MSLHSPDTIGSGSTYTTEGNPFKDSTHSLDQLRPERKVIDLDIETEDNKQDDGSYLSKVRKARIFMFSTKSDIPYMLFGTFFTIISALSPAVSSLLMGKVFQTLSDYATGQYKDNDEYMEHVTSTTMSLIALGAAGIVFIWITIYAWLQIGERQGLRARENMFKTFLNKPISWYDESEKIMGDLTQMNRCVEELRSGTAEATALMIQSIVSIITLTCVSLYTSWSVTLVMLASTPLITFLSYFFTRYIEKYQKLENTETAGAAKILDWSLSSAKLVRVFSTQDIEYEKFADAVNKSKNAFLKLTLLASGNNGILKFLMLCMFVQAFWFGSTEVRNGHLTAGKVVTCFTSCLILGETFKSLLPQILMIQKARVAIKRLQEFIELREVSTIETKFNTKIDKGYSNNILLYPETCNGDIKFKNINFAYPTRPDTKILKNVSIHFPAGQTTFLVGRSGSGKSTLGNLLLNFYQPKSGRVEIDGFTVNQLSSTWLTDNITLVEQTTTLFKDTLRNNILMGKCSDGFSSVSEKELQAACQMSLLQEVIRDLKDGLDTVVGANGVALSGGQQQRVAIARARLRDTPILILDESVSALDIVLRDLIIDAIKKWRKGKTTIILTHEYNQIGKDDYVYLMENGVVAERGYRRDLETSGLFQHLTSLQDSTVGKIHENTFALQEKRNTFLQKMNKRLSTQALSVVNPISAVQQAEELEFEVETNMNFGSSPRKQRKRTLNTMDEVEEDEGRPDLIPIPIIVKTMLKTVENRFFLFCGIVFAVLNGVCSPVFSFTFTKLLNGLVPQPGTDVGSSGYLIKWSLIVIGLAFFDGLSSFITDFFLHYSAEKWVYGLRKRCLAKVQVQGLSWFAGKTHTPAELNALLLNDARDLRTLVSDFLSVVVSIVVLATAGIVWAMVTGWKLSLVCLSLIPMFVLCSAVYSIVLQGCENNYKNAVADLETQLYEAVTGIKTIRTLRLNDYFKIKFEERVAVLKVAAFQRAFYTGLGVAITNLLTFIVQGILLYYALKLVGTGEYKPYQALQTFTLLVFSIMTCVHLMSQIPEISRGQRSGSYIFRILELEPDAVETSGDAVPSDETEDIVSFKNLNFSYPSAPHVKVLKNFSLDIKKGERVAIVGESGSGKSTLTLLLTRLFQVEKSSLYFQGKDINDIDVKWLRDNVTLVDQKAHFFDSTIYENVTYGLENVTELEIFEALKLANIYDFVISLPSGLHSRIDTSLMSGGQAQRLSIARALIRKPKLLILDECTSALDAESSSKIYELIEKNLTKKDITVVMITHAEKMMRVSSRVIALKNGKIAEDGPYNDLISQRGELFRIVTAGRLG
ncbi:hypothetical protein WICPIJ_009844 [Wickerhamomyces pijperi]|uniref:Uncharacterized protein n=1 Tax=Wickerhamomyces pijperi TaxID=599730 RepID=A0A9P8TCE2_WICPI|nr:hypothetical protein WICPIJ_009844 [Wickerhamomyces pijperi]